MPQDLSEEQQSAIDKLSATLDGDPRARLFGNGSAPGTGSDAEQDKAKAGES